VVKLWAPRTELITGAGLADWEAELLSPLLRHGWQQRIVHRYARPGRGRRRALGRAVAATAQMHRPARPSQYGPVPLPFAPKRRHRRW
jgi:hypothetical protein